MNFIPRWFHIKRQSSYAEIGRGTFQTSGKDYATLGEFNGFDGMPVIIYQDEEGTIFVRPIDEFSRTRFKEI